MLTAIILFSIEKKHINEVAEQLANMPGISEVYSVSGSYDVAAIVRVRANEDLADLVTQKISQIDSIIRTETMLAFQTHSKHDLEAMFSVGV